MPDYGHELLFGTFANPSAKSADQVVALAQVAEAADLDAVTFQDHPYNPGFLDTYSLMAWIAAKTSRILVSANVTNLPLRPPVVLAKAAASIDLLSGGRFELGLGAGAFGDAVRSMGGPEHSTADRIEALAEAIEIIRGIWKGDGAMAKFRGKHYHIAGVRAGPRPAHDINIWLGSYKPRMLALTGAKADGWLPTYEYLQSPTMVEAQALIDAAAVDAGREPRAVRRLLNIMNVSLSPANKGFLNGPVSQWVEQLSEYVLEHGFSAFLIGGDDPDVIRTFGEEIAPAVREQVARERSAGSAGTGSVHALLGAGTKPDAKAATTDLIDRAVRPGHTRYEGVRHSYIWSGKPAIVLEPRSAQEVSQAVLYAAEQNLALSVRSGGHGISGRSTNTDGIVIDLKHLNTIEVVDPARGVIRLGPGARWGEVAEKLASHGLAMSSGDYGDVGVGGLATAGGVGYFARKHGLTIDHMTAAEVVLADGRIVKTDAENEPDLFWAIRGAGGNFGIVTSFEFEAYKVGNVIQAIQVFDASETARLLENWGRLVEASPREITSFISVFPGRQGTPVAQATTVFAGDDVEAATAALVPLAEAGPLINQRAHIAAYPALVPVHGGTHRGGGPAVVRSGLAHHLTPSIGRQLKTIITSGDVMVVQIRSVGGAVNDIPAEAMAYAHRSQNFSINISGAPDRDKATNAGWEKLLPALDGMYLSFDTDTHPDRLLEAFPPQTLARLRVLKAKYDPHNLFNANFNISPFEAGLEKAS
jgi:alkanesulfonate monooxygenase SsuD/methylene tetrahydromethanopterin reductase-like flavin-dependent oxidoreductase (luciferase family)/FAD/FMN-containing dehydrogenase